MRLGVLGLLPILLVAGCSSDGKEAPDSPSAKTSPRSPASFHENATGLPCDFAIEEHAAVPHDYEAILHAVALPTAAASRQPLRAVPRPDFPNRPRYYAKAGLLVRSEKAFTISVEHPPDTALIGWGGGDRPAASNVSSEGCGGQGWLAFAGGYFIREPMCVEMTITVRGEQERVHVAAGTPCKEQAPP